MIIKKHRQQGTTNQIAEKLLAETVTDIVKRDDWFDVKTNNGWRYVPSAIGKLLLKKCAGRIAVEDGKHKG